MTNKHDEISAQITPSMDGNYCQPGSILHSSLTCPCASTITNKFINDLLSKTSALGK
jgi:hypothetical protein